MVQEDKSYNEDWPLEDLEDFCADDEEQVAAESGKLVRALTTASCFSMEGLSSGWPLVLRERLEAQWSRIRERRVDFLFHQILDLCTDDLLKVTRAYTARLHFLERELRRKGAEEMPSEWNVEVSLAQAQLHFVA